MGKLCARGKAAAKRKFKVYPSAYANMYASAVCSGKVTPGGKKKVQKKADGGRLTTTVPPMRGPNPQGLTNKLSQERKMVSSYKQGGIAKGCGGVMKNRRKKTKRS
tara:strand:- start:327 stop:644 length:318 start_codon:yes stop_codon:yes gene_type:complete